MVSSSDSDDAFGERLTTNTGARVFNFGAQYGYLSDYETGLTGALGFPIFPSRILCLVNKPTTPPYTLKPALPIMKG